MKESDLICVRQEHPDIAILTLNRPHKCNALNIELLEALCSNIELLSSHANIRALIVQGLGKVFCSGLDLSEGIDGATADHSSRLMARLITALYTSPLFTVAAIHGAALAGGAGIALACDYIIAAEGTLMGFPETRKGIVAALVAILLNRQISGRSMRELLLVGESIPAKRAYEYGLVNRIVAEDDLIAESMALAQVALKGGPEALVHTKKWIEDLHPVSFAEEVQKALAYHQQVRSSKEAHEGAVAFVEKRAPSWQS